MNYVVWWLALGAFWILWLRVYTQLEGYPISQSLFIVLTLLAIIVAMILQVVIN